MSRSSFYRAGDVPLQRSRGPMPRWVRLAGFWGAVALGAIIVSRTITVASIDEVGPPPRSRAAP